MGYNTTLLILNDGLGHIRDNLPEWWQGVEQAIGRYQMLAAPYPIPAGNFANPSSLIAVHHADVQKVLVVGGNYATVLASMHRGSAGHHRIGDREEILARLAKEYGYRLEAS